MIISLLLLTPARFFADNLPGCAPPCPVAASGRYHLSLADDRLEMTPYKKTLKTSASAKVNQTPSEMQRNTEQKTATEAPREDKGTRLWNAICNMRYTILTDPEHLTRLGNSVSRDTCPDLTFVRNSVPLVAHGPLEEHVGGDRYIVPTTLPLPDARRSERNVRIMDWTKFRERRQDQPGDHGYEQWLETLKDDLEATTSTLHTTTDTPDSIYFTFGAPGQG
ncbi:hypothetical protein HPB50_029098 [Hyalomma asiaticum]|nr:hypothetical protein HPB50_029098 [Hyalomma asiaticum]